MTTPFFPAWQAKLAAYGRRARRYRSAAEVENEFARFLESSLLRTGSGGRRRFFPVSRTFWCFLWQALQPGTSCRAVVRKVQAEQERRKVKMDSNTSAYCQARARLSGAVVETALGQSAKSADRMARRGVPGWNRPVKVIDATSFQMSDTAPNRRHYHYPTGQKKGCGFPVARALAIFSLASGAIHRLVTAPCYTAELVMLRNLWSTFVAGDIALGDRVFGCFSLLAAFPKQGVDVVARLNQSRQLKLSRKQRIGPNDWKTTFRKNICPPPYMTSKQWESLPDQVEVRIIRSTFRRKGFRTRTLWIVTTLLDAQMYPAEAIAELYGWRWQMELSFRDLKTTMQMEMLRCKTPTMIEKEIRMGLIAYNCLRALMAEAATQHDLPPQRISFKGTMDTIRSFHPTILHASSAREIRRLHARLLQIIAEDALPIRLNRTEPRAIKRRPKPYPLLTKPRHIFRELPHKGKPRRRRPHVTLT
jgi:hypothetical protein